MRSWTRTLGFSPTGTIVVCLTVLGLSISVAGTEQSKPQVPQTEPGARGKGVDCVANDSKKNKLEKCVKDLAKDWEKDKLITKKQQKAIDKCAKDAGKGK